MSDESKSESNKLKPESIANLLGYTFSIPPYQRGYRWKKETQVKDLLTDIWSYALDPTNPEDFYCLQPVVVKPMGENSFELIDGQQRLTTILLILHYLNETEFKTPKKHYSIMFETRRIDNDFLNIIADKDKASGNIDLFHLNEAYTFICWWFENEEKKRPSIKGEFYSKLVNYTKVIWYEIHDNTSLIDIFTRLNIGKIPLTNAELIKALFLSKSGNGKNDDGKDLKQLSIATEWDKIEQTLQQPDFWYFICNEPEKYDTRIELIFDLRKNKKVDHEKYHTFYEFYKDFEKDKDNPKAIDVIWSGIKEYFLTFEEWFHDRESYHLIGYLVSCGKSIETLKNNSIGISKTQFKKSLVKEAKATISKKLDELNYDDHKKEIRTTLLLFNILTIINNPKSSIRFPFHYFHSQKWDIEHIRSQTGKDIGGKDQQNWAITVLWYFAGIEWLPEKESDIVNATLRLTDEEKSYCEKLLLILKGQDPDKSVFSSLFDELSIYFKEKDSFVDPDSLSNLTLLDEGTNRMYKNAFFPVKRKHIINKEKQGVFIPLCTKNVFLKAYSQKLGEVMYWNDNDANDYFKEISETLK